MPATNYDINVRYHLNDTASKQVGMIGREARRSAQGIGILSRGLRMLQTAAVGFFGFRAAKKWLVDYNAGLEQSRIQMSGLLQMNLGGKWSDNQKNANMLIRQFRDDAKASVATTKDFVDFSSLVVGPLTRAGASMKDIRDVTRGGVIAAKAFGIQGEVAARDIEQALAGTLNKKDRFARALLEPMGMTTTKWNAMVKETPGKAADALVKAFNQPAIKMMAKAQENSWAGVVSTFEDNMQRFFGKVGMPLMKALTKEMQGWNKYLSNNQDKVQQWARDFGRIIVDAFKFAKKTITFIIENRHLLLTIAKAYLVAKAAGGIAGGLMNLGGFGGWEKLTKNLSGANGGLAKFATKLGLGAAGLGLLYVASKSIADWVDRDQDRHLEDVTKGVVSNAFIADALRRNFANENWATMMVKAKHGGLTDQQRSNARFIAAELHRMKIDPSAKDLTPVAKLLGMYKGAGGTLTDWNAVEIAAEKLNQMIDIAEFEVLGDAARLFYAAAKADYQQRMEANRSLVRSLSSYAMDLPNLMARGLGWVWSHEDPSAEKRKNNKQKVDVTVKKIEVISDDPDRIAFALVGKFQDMAANPTQTRRIQPGTREGR